MSNLETEGSNPQIEALNTLKSVVKNYAELPDYGTDYLITDIEELIQKIRDSQKVTNTEIDELTKNAFDKIDRILHHKS